MDNANLIPLSQAVETIKTAILQGQHEALKGTNRVQLAVYYGIGKYLSKNTRRFAYGTGALKAISEQLRKDMPGLRGFSETNLKNMRLFYEQWDFLDANSSVTTDESSNNQQSSVATDELQSPANQIDIYRVIAIPNITDFPIESFFSVPFSHHVDIYKKVHELPARYYYIHRTAEEHLSVEELERLIK